MDTMVWWGDDQYALSGIVVLGKVHQEATGAIPSFLTKSIEIIMRQKENKYGKKKHFARTAPRSPYFFDTFPIPSLFPRCPSEQIMPGPRRPIHKFHRRCRSSIDCVPHSKPNILLKAARWLVQVLIGEHHYSAKLGLSHSILLNFNIR